MFQTVDWTIPQLGGLLSQVSTMAPLHPARAPSEPWPAAIASSKPTPPPSHLHLLPRRPNCQQPRHPHHCHPHHCHPHHRHRRRLHRRLHHRRHLHRRPAPAAPCANRCAAAPQVIVKEERQLNQPKPPVTVKHVWNPEDLAGRPNTWNPVRQKPRQDTDKMCVRQTFPPRYSRSTMLHERRSDEVLQAFRRQQDGNDGLQMRPAGTAAAPSTMQNVTPESYAQLKPAYGANDNYATRTSAGLIGLGAREAPHSEPYFARTVVGPSLRMKSRNAPDRLQVAVYLVGPYLLPIGCRCGPC